MTNLKLKIDVGSAEKRKAHFFHAWWLCEKAKEYWDIICVELEKIYKYKLRKIPELILLGLKFENIDLIYRVWYLTTAARIQYAK